MKKVNNTPEHQLIDYSGENIQGELLKIKVSHCN